MCRAFIVLVTMALGTGWATGEVYADPHVTGIQLVARVNGDSAPADYTPKRALAEVGVELYAVLVVKDGNATTYYSDAGAIRIGRHDYTTMPLDEAPSHVLLWYKVEPTIESVSNEVSGSFKYEDIEYAETLINRMMANSLPADVRPTLTTDYGDGVGTMRYRLAAYTADGVFRTPGADARNNTKWSGGVIDKVVRVSLRRDDTYIGYLTEMYGQPYIWASAGWSDRMHQTERLEGADCADFVVYGARRMGKHIRYTFTGGLSRYTTNLGSARPDQDGVYMDASGHPMQFPAVGDLVLFPGHVGVLTADRGEIGVLDGEDLMMHALYDSPHEEGIGAAGYGERRIELLRWR